MEGMSVLRFFVDTYEEAISKSQASYHGRHHRTTANDIDEEETSERRPRSTAMKGKVTNDVILPFSNLDEPGS